MRILTLLMALAVIGGQMCGPALAAKPSGPMKPDQSPVIGQQNPSPAVAGEKDQHPAPTPPKIDPASRKAFDKGYQLFSKKKYRQACPYFYQFVADRTPDDADYEWAQFFLGISLKKIGLSHAAVDVLSDLTIRKPNPQIVTYCLELFEETMRRLPFDHDLLINRVLGDQDYDFVQGPLADFVNYYQGLYAWQHGFQKWGDDHFGRIKPDSHYYNCYLYQKALLKVSEDRLPEAITFLRRIINDPDETDELLDEVRKTLARLLYEIGEYREADRLYCQIQENILQQSRNLMERAWAHYRMGNPERAMGLLYAFEAPSFRDAFTPEYFILKSFIYKDVCHYQSALDMVSEFKARYGGALEHIYQRDDARANHTLMLAILSKKKVEDVYRFLELLESEKKRCAQFDKSPALLDYLQSIYALQMEESRADLRELVEKEYEKMANELLEYEEKAHLMEYEIGLDMYQRVYQHHYKEEKPGKKADDKGIAVYPFQGEFWNDELADYKVVLPNKCENMEEWDIFLK